MNEQRITSFSNEGLIFNVIDTGPMEGETIVLLHGWPQTPAVWAKVSLLLNQQGYRTLAPVMRGYSSASTPRPNKVDAYRIAVIKDDVVALILQLNKGAVHLVGHDWGSAVAWDLAAKHPDLVNSLTSIAVPHPAAVLKAMLYGSQLVRSAYMLFFLLPKVPEFVAEHFSPMFRKMLSNAGMNKAQVDAVYENVVLKGFFTNSLNYYRAMPLGDTADLKRKVNVPTVHVHGARDSAFSNKTAELVAQYVTAPYRLKVFESATHWIPEQNSEELVQLICEFIASV